MKMNTRSRLSSPILSLVLGLFLSVAAHAEQSADFGDFVVYYNAVRTDFFNPEVAKAYGITRSRHRALLTISVLRKRMGLAAQPVEARVEARGVNLSNQIKEIKVREIKEPGAVYYIAELPVTNGETIDFTITVQPEGGEERTVTFRQEFVTD
jgi:hypothetical protein